MLFAMSIIFLHKFNLCCQISLIYYSCYDLTLNYREYIHTSQYSIAHLVERASRNLGTGGLEVRHVKDGLPGWVGKDEGAFGILGQGWGDEAR